MKTSVIEVRDMLSVLSVLGVERRVGDVPGVDSVTVNYAAGNATVRYDETRLDVADIKSAVRQSAYESAPPTASGDSHEGHLPLAAPAEIPLPAPPQTSPPASDPADAAQHHKGAPAQTSKVAPVARAKVTSNVGSAAAPPSPPKGDAAPAKTKQGKS